MHEQFSLLYTSTGLRSWKPLGRNIGTLIIASSELQLRASLRPILGGLVVASSIIYILTRVTAQSTTFIVHQGPLQLVF
ncbi:hypothetical protein BDR05DRAFT_959860 [Suillus weaverae]|nr:hypothetical protein BDR05DRAFT_959860 [Suillus weaverae]